MTMTDETPVTAPDGPQETPGEPPATPRLTVDAAAPYGRTATGQPRAKPGRKAKSAPGVPGAPRRRTSSGARTGASARKAAAAPRPTYADGLKHYLRAGIGAMVTFGRRSVAMQANAMTLANYGPDVCDALGDIADSDPRWAGALDRVMGAGPYAELAEKLSPLVVQLLVNNGVLPLTVGQHMGAEDPAMLAGLLRAEMVAKAEANAQGV